MYSFCEPNQTQLFAVFYHGVSHVVLHYFVSCVIFQVMLGCVYMCLVVLLLCCIVLCCVVLGWGGSCWCCAWMHALCCSQSSQAQIMSVWHQCSRVAIVI